MAAATLGLGLAPPCGHIIPTNGYCLAWAALGKMPFKGSFISHLWAALSHSLQVASAFTYHPGDTQLWKHRSHLRHSSGALLSSWKMLACNGCKWGFTAIVTPEVAGMQTSTCSSRSFRWSSWKGWITRKGHSHLFKADFHGDSPKWWEMKNILHSSHTPQEQEEKSKQRPQRKTL